MKENLKSVCIRVSRYQKIKDYSDRTKIPIVEVLSMAIDHFIKSQEDYKNADIL